MEHRYRYPSDIDTDIPPEGRYRPVLATFWTVQADERGYILGLNVRWVWTGLGVDEEVAMKRLFASRWQGEMAVVDVRR